MVCKSARIAWTTLVVRRPEDASFRLELSVVDDEMGMQDSLFALGFAGSVVIVVGNRHLEAADALSFRTARVKPLGCPLVHEVAEVIEFNAAILFVQRDDEVLVGADLGVLFDGNVVAEKFLGSCP